MIEQLRRRMLLGVLFGVIVISAVFIATDSGALLDALGRFNWRLTPIVIGLVIANYLLRFVKWQYYVRLNEVEGLRLRDSLLVFLSGFSMLMTPGKVGEFLKAYLVRSRTGTPVSRTIPIVYVERFTDGAGLLILAGCGLLAFRYGWPFFILAAVLMIVHLILIQHEPFMTKVFDFIGKTRLGRSRIEGIRELYQSTRSLLRLRPFGTALGISTVSWFFECVALYVVLLGLGFDQSWSLLLACTFIFATSAWLGAVSMLPGGLGATEASAAGLMLLIIDDPLMTSAIAGSATLLLRFATLWFGVAIGIVALSITSHWKTTEEEPEPAGAPEVPAG